MTDAEVRSLIGLTISQYEKLFDGFSNYLDIDANQVDISELGILNTYLRNFGLLETEYRRKLERLIFITKDKLYTIESDLIKNGNILKYASYISNKIDETSERTIKLIEKYDESMDLTDYDQVIMANKTERKKFLDHHINKELSTYIEPKLYPNLIDPLSKNQTIYTVFDLEYYLNNTTTFKYYILQQVTTIQSIVKKF